MIRATTIAAGILAVLTPCVAVMPAQAQEGSAAPVASRCEVVRAAAPLPEQVRETSGLARGAAGFWTHNDAGNEPVLYRIDDAGALAQVVAIGGATLTDWEDIEAAPCDDGTCLFIGDIGDNDGERAHVTIFRVAEPAPGAEAVQASAVRLTYPDGARDAEALFIVGGTAYVVTKGRGEEIALHRVPAAAWQAGTGQLERVRTLLPRPRSEADRITAATTTPDGSRVAIRSYSTLYVYDASALTSGADVAPVTRDLRPFGQLQGESIVMADDGTVWLTSEAEDRNAAPSWMQLRCALQP